ncbi:MAG: sialidase family protein [Victivallaceae bacterium]
MQIIWTGKIYSDGRHNAFTGLAYFKDKYFLAFRNSAGHMQAESYQIIMTSPDGKKWDLLQKKHMPDGMPVDYRDSCFLLHEDKLLLYSFCTPIVDGKRGKSYTQIQIISGNSGKISEPQIIQRDCVLWKPIKLGDTFYAPGYSCGKCHYQADLYCSAGGLDWKKKTHLAAGSEIALCPLDENKLTAFVRTETPPYHLEIFESRKPFAAWTKISEIPRIIQCPHYFRNNGKVYLIGRERPDYMKTADSNNPSFGRHRTKIWSFENHTLREVLELPSAGDNSYPGTVFMPDGTLLISYYSQHECGGEKWAEMMPADIFVAAVRI